MISSIGSNATASNRRILERESAYIIDGLMHNDVVKSDIHSSDTAGYSEAVFGTAHLLGFSYARRI